MKRLLSSIVALALAASPLVAQARPDFSGKWALDLSSAPAVPAGTSVVMTIKQDEKTINVGLVVNSTMGEQKRTTAVNLDGSTSKNTMETPMGNIDFTSSFAWDGAAGVTTSKGEAQGQTFVQTEKFTLDADGKTLRLETTVSVAGQNHTNTLAFKKQ
jgi:hypothetical protein